MCKCFYFEKVARYRLTKVNLKMTATCKFGLIINEQTMHCSSTVSALINVQMPFHDVVSFG